MNLFKLPIFTQNTADSDVFYTFILAKTSANFKTAL